jgi:hypothetical protein
MQRTAQLQSIGPDTAALLLAALALEALGAALRPLLAHGLALLLTLAGWRPAAAAPAAPPAPVKRPEPTRPRPTNAPTRKRAARTLQGAAA